MYNIDNMCNDSVGFYIFKLSLNPFWLIRFNLSQSSDVDARYDISIFVEISRYRYFRYFSAYRCIDTRYGYNKLNYHCVKPKNGRKVCCFRQLCELYFIYCKVKLIYRKKIIAAAGIIPLIPQPVDRRFTPTPSYMLSYTNSLILCILRLSLDSSKKSIKFHEKNL